MKKTILFFLVCIIMTPLQSQDLRVKLETSLNAFTDAVKTKNAEKLKASLSAYAYMSIKNQLVSSGAKFPEDFFTFAPKMLTDINKLQFRKAVKNGATAFCIYSGKDRYGDTSLFVFKFLSENEVWKFNMAEEKSSDLIKTSVRIGDFSFLDTREKYKPDGIVPVVPAEIVPGDYKAMLDVMCYGYEVQVTVNGVFQKLVKGGSYSGVIMGGLKKGKNKIELTVKLIEGEDVSTLRVGIRALIKEAEKDAVSIEEKTPPATIVKEFVIE